MTVPADNSTNAPTSASRADVGLVCALPLELAPLWTRCASVRKYTGGDFTFRGGRLRGLRLVGVEAGAGLSRAARAAQALLDAHQPDWLLSVGLSGGLTPAVQIGQVVIGSSVQTLDSAPLAIDVHCDADPQRGLHIGRLVSTAAIVRTVAEKRQLHARTGCLAVDLESCAVAEVCRQRQVRFLPIRGVSDDLSADLPAEVLSIFGSSSYQRLGAAAGALWRRPGCWNDLWRLREQAHRAAEAMVGTLVELLPLLAPSSAAATSLRGAS
jgi:adenosylhomocysteine nucleosidase